MKRLTLVLSLMLLMTLSASAQLKKTDIFNPVYTAVTSQTIAPDARAAVWVMSELLQIPM